MKTSGAPVKRGEIVSGILASLGFGMNLLLGNAITKFSNGFSRTDLQWVGACVCSSNRKPDDHLIEEFT